MRLINEIIVHTFATKEGWFDGKPFADKVAEVRRWHLLRKFNDIGYHYLIGRKGEVATGRNHATAGAHTRGRNTNSIGISLEGGFGHKRTDPFLDVYTVAQGKALLQLLDTLQTEYGPLKISPHNLYANKECPAFDLTAFLASSPVEPAKPAFKASPIALVVGAAGIGAATWWEQLKTFIGGIFG